MTHGESNVKIHADEFHFESIMYFTSSLLNTGQNLRVTVRRMVSILVQLLKKS